MQYMHYANSIKSDTMHNYKILKILHSIDYKKIINPNHYVLRTMHNRKILKIYQVSIMRIIVNISLCSTNYASLQNSKDLPEIDHEDSN